MPDFQVWVSSSYSAPWERGKNSYQEENSARPAVDEDRVVRGGGDQLARTVAGHRRAYVVGQHDLQPVLHLLAGVQALGRAAQQRGGLCVAGRLGPLGGGGEQRLALGADQGDVDAGRDLDLGVVHPGLPRVAPALDPERPRALGVQRDRGGPPVEAERGGRVHRHQPSRCPSGSVSTTEALTASWPSRKTCGPDRDRLADRGLGRVGAALDHRRHLDHRDPVDRGAELRRVDHHGSEPRRCGLGSAAAGAGVGGWPSRVVAVRCRGS